METHTALRLVDRGIELAQPFHEFEHFFVPPHPGRKSLECLPTVTVLRRVAPHVLIDAGGIRPIGLDRHEANAAALDQGFRDLGPDAIELRGAVRGFADQHRAHVTDAFDNRPQVGTAHVADRLGDFADQLTDQGRPSQHLGPRRGFQR